MLHAALTRILWQVDQERILWMVLWDLSINPAIFLIKRRYIKRRYRRWQVITNFWMKDYLIRIRGETNVKYLKHDQISLGKSVIKSISQFFETTLLSTANLEDLDIGCLTQVFLVPNKPD